MHSSSDLKSWTTIGIYIRVLDRDAELISDPEACIMSTKSYKSITLTAMNTEVLSKK